MNSFRLIILCASASLVAGQESAHVTLFCNSLRFPPASAESETLSLTTDPNGTEITNELAPVGDPSLPDHGAEFVLEDAAFGKVPGEVFFNTPPFTDANENGFNDFFEVSQAVAPTTTQGIFDNAVDTGTVKALWSRAAGSSTGTCKLQMTGQDFGQLPDFTFTFHVLTYQGTLTYRAATNGISGTLSLTNLEDATDVLEGQASLTRAAGTDRFNVLTLNKGTLTNRTAQTLAYQSDEIQRDTNLRTNYYGFPVFDDADLTTSTADFRSWTLSIDDVNDANGNGVPDLSDDPTGSAAGPPKLTLISQADHLLLTIDGTMGAIYDLEATASFSPVNWQKLSSITLTNAAQTMQLKIPSISAEFWRLRQP